MIWWLNNLYCSCKLRLVEPYEEQQQDPENQIRNDPKVTDPKNLTEDQIESEKARRLLKGEEVDGVTFDF